MTKRWSVLLATAVLGLLAACAKPADEPPVAGAPGPQPPPSGTTTISPPVPPEPTATVLDELGLKVQVPADWKEAEVPSDMKVAEVPGSAAAAFSGGDGLPLVVFVMMPASDDTKAAFGDNFAQTVEDMKADMADDKTTAGETSEWTATGITAGRAFAVTGDMGDVGVPGATSGGFSIGTTEGGQVYFIVSVIGDEAQTEAVNQLRDTAEFGLEITPAEGEATEGDKPAEGDATEGDKPAEGEGTEKEPTTP